MEVINHTVFWCKMNRNGPVIIIEDDIDDWELLEEVFGNLGYTYKLIFFNDGYEALAFLNAMTVAPF